MYWEDIKQHDGEEQFWKEYNQADTAQLIEDLARATYAVALLSSKKWKYLRQSALLTLLMIYIPGSVVIGVEVGDVRFAPIIAALIFSISYILVDVINQE